MPNIQEPVNPTMSSACDAIDSGYQLCGLRVASALPLPDLPPWHGNNREPDLIIDFGLVPRRLNGVILERPLLQVAEDGYCRFSVPNVGAWLISPDGRRITLDTRSDTAAEDIRTFLYGTVFAVVCFRRGLMPLHASCILRNGKAVAFSGHSGVGKSTLAAMLTMKGFDMLADDVTVLDMHAGQAVVLPSFPRVKLWRDALERLGLSAEGLERSRLELEKFHLPTDERFHDQPVPLAEVVILDSQSVAPALPRKLSLMNSITRMGDVLYRPQLVKHLGLDPMYMQHTMQLASSVGGFKTVRRPTCDEDLERLIAALWPSE